MAGDISRSSFQRLKGNTGVRMQQGRVQLDADWNEQLDIQAWRERTLTSDLLGSAAPVAHAGFAIQANGNTLAILPGRMYVDGILCESAATYLAMPIRQAIPPPNEPPNPGTSTVRHGTGLLSFSSRVDIAQAARQSLAVQTSVAKFNLSSFNHVAAVTNAATAAATVTDPAAAADIVKTPAAVFPLQPFVPALPVFSKNTYAVFLDVWERDITVLDDPSIREVALGGPDTTTRTRVVWQVRLAQQSSTTCSGDLSALVAPSTGQLRAQAAANASSANPCVLPASAGYRSLENQLYRVEIHTPGPVGKATFKWSRDNASVAVAWQSGGGGSDLSVASLGRDDVLGFAGGQWVELIDDTHQYTGTPGTLVQLSNAQLVGQVPTLSLNAGTASGSTTFTDFPQTPIVRRWDQTASLTAGTIPVTEGAWIDLEQGVQVFFEPGGSYNTGDYWLIPARTATTASQPTVIWPVDNTNAALAQTPNGIRHHYAPLAIASVDGSGQWSVVCDCRSTFGPISTPAAVEVLSAHTAEPTPIPLTPFAQIAPAHLLAGVSITCDQPLSLAALNVATISLSIDLPATDERFAETAIPGQQVPAAIAVKALGNYGLSSNGATVTWIPFPSTRAYFLRELANFAVLTAGQGKALVRIAVETSAIKAGACSGSSPLAQSTSTLALWALPYTETSVPPAPVFGRLLQILGPDSAGNFIALGMMSSLVFTQMKALPLPDVAGDKLFATPLEILPSTFVYGFVPTAADRAGNFSSFLLPIQDPRTGGLLAGNQIPVAEMPSPTSQNGIFAWRFRGFVPAPAPSYAYGYANSAIGGELI